MKHFICEEIVKTKEDAIILMKTDSKYKEYSIRDEYTTCKCGQIPCLVMVDDKDLTLIMALGICEECGEEI